MFLSQYDIGLFPSQLFKLVCCFERIINFYKHMILNDSQESQ